MTEPRKQEGRRAWEGARLERVAAELHKFERRPPGLVTTTQLVPPRLTPSCEGRIGARSDNGGESGHATTIAAANNAAYSSGVSFIFCSESVAIKAR